MKTDLFDYPLPERLIAQVPIARRDASRLLVVHRAECRVEHRQFHEIGEFLRAGDTLFRNNAAVIPARLHATRPTGGAVECLLLRPAAEAGGALQGGGARSAERGGQEPSGMQKAERGTPEGGGALSAERGAPEQGGKLKAEGGMQEGGGARSAERGGPEQGGRPNPQGGTPEQSAKLKAERGMPEGVRALGTEAAVDSRPTPSGIPHSAFSIQHSDGAAPSEWWCLLRPGKKLPVGATFAHGTDFTGTVLEKTDDGLARVAFQTAEGNILAVANRLGEMPLPPYIAERTDDAARLVDRDRYQTVYADRGHQVAAAAPTAGLHFTPELLARLAAAGINFADLTLHVGLGTFRPITSEHIEDHAIHREIYEIPAATQRALLQPSGRRIAVGTTSVRSIEDYLAEKLSPNAPGRPATPPATAIQPPGFPSFGPSHFAEASIFIYPPRAFRGVDALITNFHQPRSTLLCLVSAFLTPGSTDGIAWLKEIYAEAVAREYRFFSYGDAMLIL